MNVHKTLILFIYFSNNNILFNLTNLEGNLKFFTTTGSKKIKGTRKISLTALKTSILVLARFLNEKHIHIKIRGVTKFKRLTLKLLLKSINSKILSFCDLTSIPHNGVKNSKLRRI